MQDVHVNPALDKDEGNLFPINFPVGLGDNFHHIRPGGNYAVMGEGNPPIGVSTGEFRIHRLRIRPVPLVFPMAWRGSSVSLHRLLTV